MLDLKRLIAASKRKYYPARQRLSTQSAKDDKPVVLKDSATLGQCGLADGDTILFKDLGPQVGGTGLDLPGCCCGAGQRQ